MHQRRLVRIQVLTDAWENAAKLTALCFDFLALARQSPHVGGRTAQVGYDTREAWTGVTDLLDFAHD